MNRTLKNILLFLPLLLACACTQSEFQGEDSYAVPPGMCKLNFTIDGMDEGASRALAPEGNEILIKDVHILFYEKDNDSYITYQHAEVTPGTSAFTFPVPEQIVANKEYRTLVVANSHSHIPPGFNKFDDYLSQKATEGYTKMKQDMIAVHNLNHTDENGKGFGGLPMWGEMLDNNGNPTGLLKLDKLSTGAMKFTGSVHFSRSVCRIDINNTVADKLIIEKVKLCNYRPGGYCFHESLPYGNIVDGHGDKGKWINVPAPSVDKTQKVEAAIYTFPNMVPVVSQNDKETTYIMIAGYYQDGKINTPTAPKTKLTYYRFNMAENGKSQVLRRNFRYLGTILSVKGHGADDEQGAHNAASPMLGFKVDNDWRSDESGTKVDADGSYITLSHTQLIFEGYQGRSEIIKVKAEDKNGKSLDWVIKDSHSGTDDNAAFEWKKLDANSFSVTTKDDNKTDFTKTMHLSVQVSDNSDLVLPVSIMQLSSKLESRVLLVEGKTGVLEYTLPGSGGTLELQVQTGSPYSGWIAESDDITVLGATYTPKGADRGFLVIDVPANIGSSTRTASIRVKRLLSKQDSGSSITVDKEVGEITINLSQPKSEQLLTVFPMPASSTNGFVIDAFSANTNKQSRNGICFSKEFYVRLADPKNYTWKVESDFFKDYDLALSLESPLPVETQATFTDNEKCLNKIEGNKNGQKFYINVFRTGPGDPLIKGTITVTAVPIAGVQGESSSVSFTVQIRTLCDIDEVKVGDLVVADRNIGALPRLNQQSAFVPALNYSQDEAVRITGYPSPDSDNRAFIGSYLRWLEIRDYGKLSRVQEEVMTSRYAVDMYAKLNIDPNSKYHREEDVEKWRLPTKDEFEKKLKPRICYSKQRAFFVSDEKTIGGRSIGCFLQIGGVKRKPDSDEITDKTVWYWTSQYWPDYSYGCYSWSWVVYPDGKKEPTTGYNYYDGSKGQEQYRAPVRCVRSIE